MAHGYHAIGLSNGAIQSSASSASQTLYGSSPVSFEQYANMNGIEGNPYSLGNKFINWFTGNVTSAEQKYENYLNEYKYRRDQKAQEAEWSRDDSSVQRAVKDIEAAGLNPWVAINGGSMSSAMSASNTAPLRYQVKEKQLKDDANRGKLLGSALKLLLMMAIMH